MKIVGKILKYLFLSLVAFFCIFIYFLLPENLKVLAMFIGVILVSISVGIIIKGLDKQK